MAENCLFCKIRDEQIPAEIVYRDQEILAFKDINPAAPIHILFIPTAHIPTLNDLDEEESSVVGKIYLKIKEVAERLGLAEKGYRVVANCNADGGQQVFHIHFHLLGGRGLSWPPG